jgi:hypothetical protein
MNDNDSTASTLSDRPVSGWGTAGRPAAFTVTGWHTLAQNQIGNDQTHPALQAAAVQLPPPVHNLPVPPAPIPNTMPERNTPVSADSSAAEPNPVAAPEPTDHRRADALRVAALLGKTLTDNDNDSLPRLPADPLPLIRQSAPTQTEPHCNILRQAAVRRRPISPATPPVTRKRNTSPPTEPLRRSTRNKSNK